jgi:hypothetical protein
MEENQSLLELQVDQDATASLTEISRWGKLLGLLAVIGFGLLFVFVLIFSGRLAGYMVLKEDTAATDVAYFRIGIFIGFAFVGAILIVLMSFLIRGANRIRLGIRNKDQLLFNSGLASLKNYFTMYGVLVLIALFFSLLALTTR